jgi:MFS family permease
MSPAPFSRSPKSASNPSSSRRRDAVLLGIGQTVAFGSSFYLPSVLAPAIAQDTGVASSTVFAALAMALLIGAATGVVSGRAVDRFGGQSVLLVACVLFALGLAGLGLAHTALGLCLAWIVIGVAMGTGLYDTAFATLVRSHGQNSRNAITGVTLIAGFASTICWPVTLALESHFGWRVACFAWAGAHVLLVMPLYVGLSRVGADAQDLAAANDNGHADAQSGTAVTGDAPAQRSTLTVAMLALAFTCTGFLGSALATLLPQLLQSMGLAAAQAVAFAALMGPAQVAGRLLEFGVMRKVHPLWSARVAAAAHPLAAGSLLLAGPIAAPVFAALHGAGNGMLTVVKGTLPLALFGASGYGARQGLLLFPAKIAQALAPWLFGLAIAGWGADALWLSAALGCVASLGFWRIKSER